MSRDYAGHTELGSKLNRLGSSGEPSQIKRKRTKRGLIKKVIGSNTGYSEYIVILDIYDSNGKFEMTTRPIPLVHDANYLAANYGSPEDLVNRYWCEVQYEGPTVDRGRAIIIGDRIRNKELASKSNELQTKGTAFAPPGSGLM